MTPGAFVPVGVHLVGSVPLPSADDVFRTVSAALGGRVRRLPDGETGPRADWIVWQYPVLSSRPEFEVGPPTPGFYRALPRLQLRPEAPPPEFGALGYADAAIASYDRFSRLARDGVVPSGCRFQVSLPTPLAPIAAFVALDDQAAVEPAYEAAMTRELERLLDAIPHDRLSVQWDTNFELGLLDGSFPAWFDDVEAGVLERLVRISTTVPADVELGFHLCSGHDEQAERTPPDLRRVVALANGLAGGLGRAPAWVHMPVPEEGGLEALRDLRLDPATELYLGVLYPAASDQAVRGRILAAHEAVGELGIATPCGWGRLPPSALPELLERHVALSRPFADAAGDPGRPFAWPAGFERIPAEEWVDAQVDSFGLDYDTVENHGWYRNLDLTVEQLAGDLEPGEILLDYSGGTGILLDRLRLRIFDRQVGMLIVDSSPKFLRVALDRFRGDPRVAFRRLRYLRGERRLQYLHEVLPAGFAVDGIVSTNAIHLYDDLENTLASWHRTLRPGGRVRINSGNIRNPRAAENEWIIDETVYVAHEVATGLVRTEPRFAAYREVLDDPARLSAYLAHRDRVFLAPRPLQYYLDVLEQAGFAVEDVSERTIEADVGEWFAFLATYADAVLGWVGGNAKVDGGPAGPEAAADRLELLRRSLDLVFGGRPTFRCCWTYVTASRG
jgi:SAM-dependent methyltransferase